MSLLFEVSPYILKAYHNKIAEPLSYYRKETIKKKVAHANISPAQKEEIERYLKEITKRNQSLQTLQRKHRSAINLLKALEINPVPLSSQIRDVPFLESIYHFIELEVAPKKPKGPSIESQRAAIMQARRINSAKKWLKKHRKR